MTRETVSDGASGTHIISMAEHAASMRTIYREVLRSRGWVPVRPGDSEELDFLQSALFSLGFASHP